MATLKPYSFREPPSRPVSNTFNTIYLLKISIYPAKGWPGSGTTEVDSGAQKRLRRSRIEGYGPCPQARARLARAAVVLPCRHAREVEPHIHKRRECNVNFPVTATSINMLLLYLVLSNCRFLIVCHSVCVCWTNVELIKPVSNVHPCICPSVRPSVRKKILRFQWNLACS